MKYTYLWINFLTVMVPLLFSFHPKFRFNLYFKAFLKANLTVSFLFISWDILFTKLEVWGFNPSYLTGIYLFNLPIEEVLFFICIPFACVFSYYCLNTLFSFYWSQRTENIFIPFASGILLSIGLFYNSKIYTSITFISLGLILLILKYKFKSNWLGQLIIIYPILLIPFFLVNGVLTGSFIEEPIVWYNLDEIIGIRLFTIPLEDVFYGFELILLNVFFFEKFKVSINIQNH